MTRVKSTHADVKIYDNKPGGGKPVKIPLTNPYFTTHLLTALSFTSARENTIREWLALKVPAKAGMGRGRFIMISSLSMQEKFPNGIGSIPLPPDEIVRSSNVTLKFRILKNGRAVDGHIASRPFSIEVASHVAAAIHNRSLEERFISVLEKFRTTNALSLTGKECYYTETTGDIVCPRIQDVEFLIKTYAMPDSDSLTAAQEGIEDAYREIGPAAAALFEDLDSRFKVRPDQRKAGIKNVIRELYFAKIRARMQGQPLSFTSDIPWDSGFGHSTRVFVSGHKGRYAVYFKLSGDSSSTTAKAFRMLDKKRCRAELSLKTAEISIPLHSAGSGLFFAHIPQLEALYGKENVALIIKAIGESMLRSGSEGLRHTFLKGNVVKIHASPSECCDIQVRLGDYILFRQEPPEKVPAIFRRSDSARDKSRMKLEVTIRLGDYSGVSSRDGDKYDAFVKLIRQFKLSKG